jgi:hypothetical protein
MKLKKLIAIYLFVFLALIGTTVLANIFASHVEVEFDGNFPATISYTLNEWATSVVITIKQNDVVVKTISIVQDENGSFKGPNSILWSGDFDNGESASNGIYIIEILAKDDIGHGTWELISFDQGPDNWFWSSVGVAANRRQTSPNFGMVYVCERSGGTATNLDAIYTERGLYLFNSFAFYWGYQQSTSYAEGNSVVSWIPFGGNVPLGVYVGPDDRIYLSVLGTSGIKGGVVSGDGLYSATSVEEILTLENLSNHGPVSRSAVVGTGAARTLYTCEQLGESTDFDPQTLSADTKSVLRRYRIGDSTGPYSGLPEQLLGDILERPFDLDFDSKGYLYVVQNETNEKAIANDTWGLSKWDMTVDPPQEVWHVPTDSLPPSDFEPVALLPRLIGFTDEIDSPSAPAANFVGLDIDEPRNRLYVARRGANSLVAGGPIYQILQFSIDTGEFTDGFDTSVNVYIVDGDTIVDDLGTASDRGYNQRDVAVDAAGNVISVNSNTEALRVYSPPDGPNSFLTFSPWAIQIGSGDPVIPTPIIPATYVEEKRNPTVNLDYNLSQNYPNPFNSSTTISFTLPAQEKVKITLYDLLGREIDIITDRDYAAGNHKLKYSAFELLSGVYIYKFQTDSFTQIRKMLYIK